MIASSFVKPLWKYQVHSQKLLIKPAEQWSTYIYHLCCTDTPAFYLYGATKQLPGIIFNIYVLTISTFSIKYILDRVLFSKTEGLSPATLPTQKTKRASQRISSEELSRNFQNNYSTEYLQIPASDDVFLVMY